MSVFLGGSETNRFRVKDEAVFKTWAARHDMEVYELPNEPGLFGLAPNEDNGLFRLMSDDEDEDEDEEGDLYELDLSDVLWKHLAPGSVAVIMTAGAENGVVGGSAEAVDHNGKKIFLCLDQIFELAKVEFGVTPARW